MKQMSEVVTHGDTDADDLSTFGYKQRLSRNLGSFSTFAAGFSVISILTGTFQLFGTGYGFGGPLLFWGWLLVFAGQFCVALVFSELGARVPIAGSVYQWARHVSTAGRAWFAGWMMLLANFVTIAAASTALQIVLPPIWSGFQVFENNTQNAVFLGLCSIALTTFFNALGVKVMSRINNVGVAAELIGVVGVLILLAMHIQRGPEVIFTTQGAGPSSPGWDTLGLLAPLLMASMLGAWVMFGFDTAGDLAEETKDPRKRTPIAIRRALTVSGVGGALLIILAVMSAPTLDLTELGAGGLPLVLESALGPVAAKLLLADVAIAIFVCQLAVQTAGVRLAFSMAREKKLPFASLLSHVTHHRQSPVAPAIVLGLLAAATLLLSLGSAQIFLVVTSVATAFAYIAYLFITAPTFVRRLKGWPLDEGRTGLFTIGRKRALIVNGIAVVWGALMTVNLLWPREAVFGEGAFQWGGVIAVAIAAIIGAIYYPKVRAREGEIVAEHQVTVSE